MPKFGNVLYVTYRTRMLKNDCSSVTFDIWHLQNFLFDFYFLFDLFNCSVCLDTKRHKYSLKITIISGRANSSDIHGVVIFVHFISNQGFGLKPLELVILRPEQVHKSNFSRTFTLRFSALLSASWFIKDCLINPHQTWFEVVKVGTFRQ